MNELKNYIITSDEYVKIVVSLSEREATILKNFLEWGEIESQFTIESAEDYEGVNWGI